MSDADQETSVAGADWFVSGRLHKVLDMLNADGGEARIVGGAVRNTLMGLPVGDVDIATTLLPQEPRVRNRSEQCAGRHLSKVAKFSRRRPR